MNNTIGSTVKKLREERGMTQRDVSEMMGIDHSYLSKIERGVQNPSLNTIRRLSEFFGVEISLSSNVILDDDDLIAEKIKLLDDDSKKIIENLVDLLIQKNK
ncbi:helix-turn-helix domain-containing protein [Bacillus velezensis]|uniref:helix-turn-helix domain-containing protein n=2 Tax=Bacillus velezensis TaxID=492670 RepID=UPI0023BAA7AB|nr:helix-turn-helix transcriptional regulator [Bacillus velezensis]